MATSLDFVHEPLDLAHNTIRVLSILPDLSDSPIRCLIKQIRREDRHVCLSYTWGDESEQSLIELDGKRFMVRPNLLEFLHRARPEYCNELLWIDAICIDQRDVRERNHQVQQMADIYASSKLVLMWAGHVSGDLAGFVRKFHKWSFILRHPLLMRMIYGGTPAWREGLN